MTENAGSAVLPYTALFPPKGHRYFTDERIEELREQAIAAGHGTVELPALTVIELICDWRNMAADAAKASAADLPSTRSEASS